MERKEEINKKGKDGLWRKFRGKPLSTGVDNTYSH